MSRFLTGTLWFSRLIEGLKRLKFDEKGQNCSLFSKVYHFDTL